MKTLRRICTGAMGAVIGVTSVIVIPLAAASPAAAGAPSAASCTPDTGYTNCVRYTYTGADDTFTVPAGVTSVRAKLWGAGGGGVEPFPEDEQAGGGAGGFTTATLAVTPNTVLSLNVGEGGHKAGTAATYGGGGAAGDGSYAYFQGGSGGGMSAIFDATSSPLLIAGGGGGAGGVSEDGMFYNGQQAGGGGGGGLAATAVDSSPYVGGPGTQLAGGTAAAAPLESNCVTTPTSGTQYVGGTGGSATANSYQNVDGGGGGGGYFGGGGGACSYRTYTSQQELANEAAGGGGSGYVAGAGVTDATTTAGAAAHGIFTNATAAGSDDSLYDAGIGQGGSYQDGGNGEIVLEWTIPAAPTPAPLTSNGTGMAGQAAQVTVPEGGSVTLLDGSDAVTSITVPNEGGYTLNAVTGVISFSPAAGFSGSGSGVTYQVTDAYGQSGSSTYKPDVALPSAPTLQPIATSGKAGSAQSTQVPVPAGGSIALLSGNDLVNSLAVPGQGTYSANPETGLVKFTPVAGFVGKAQPSMLRVSDAYGRHADASYSATVTPNATVAPNKVVASVTAPRSMKIVSQAQTLPAVCKLTVRKIGHCDITLVYRNTKGSYVVGTGSVTSSQATGTAGQLVTQVKLNAVGHYLAGIATIPTWVYAAITPYGSRTALPATTHTAFANKNVK